jgi:hypothetical protein
MAVAAPIIIPEGTRHVPHSEQQSSSLVAITTEVNNLKQRMDRMENIITDVQTKLGQFVMATKVKESSLEKQLAKLETITMNTSEEVKRIATVCANFDKFIIEYRSHNRHRDLGTDDDDIDDDDPFLDEIKQFEAARAASRPTTDSPSKRKRMKKKAAAAKAASLNNSSPTPTASPVASHTRSSSSSSSSSSKQLAFARHILP